MIRILKTPCSKSRMKWLDGDGSVSPTCYAAQEEESPKLRTGVLSAAVCIYRRELQKFSVTAADPAPAAAWRPHADVHNTQNIIGKQPCQENFIWITNSASKDTTQIRYKFFLQYGNLPAKYQDTELLICSSSSRCWTLEDYHWQKNT